MDSDAIVDFIKNKKKFSLNLIINAHTRLSLLQLKKGSIQQDDVMLCFHSQLWEKQINSADLTAYISLFFQSVITNVMSSSGQVKFQVNSDSINNDEFLLTSILTILNKKYFETDLIPQLDAFKHDVDMYLRHIKQLSNNETVSNEEMKVNSTDRRTLPLPPPPSTSPSVVVSTSPSSTELNIDSKHYYPSNTNSSAPNMPNMLDLNHTNNHINMAEYMMENNNMNNMNNYYVPPRIDIERTESIVRLLAHVRKVGMDILFPQVIHDKILAIIFVAVKSFSTPAHRELIDMVMTVKDSNVMPNLESVSKTKIRGVLALLKHGELLTTQSEFGEPVRLSLTSGIDSFQSLRERHDSFLKSYMIDHHLFIPSPLRSELLWQVDEASRLLRLESMNNIVLKVKAFFRSREEYRANALDCSELSSVVENTALNSVSNTITTTSMGDNGNGSHKHIIPGSSGSASQQQQAQQYGYAGSGRTGTGGRLGGGAPAQTRGGLAGSSGGRAGFNPYNSSGRYGAPPFAYPAGATSGGAPAGYGPSGFHANTRAGAGSGYGNNYPTRAQQQRYSGTQSSYTNSEDYMETGSTVGGNGRTRSIPSSARSYLSSQALSFEPNAINGANQYNSSRSAPEPHYGLVADSLNANDEFFQNNNAQLDHHRSSSSVVPNHDPKFAAKRQSMFASLSKLAEDTPGPGNAPGSFDPMTWLSQAPPPPPATSNMSNSRVMSWDTSINPNNSAAVALENASFFIPTPPNMTVSVEDSEPIDFGVLSAHAPPFPAVDANYSSPLRAYRSSGISSDYLDLSLSFDSHTAVENEGVSDQHNLHVADPFPVPADGTPTPLDSSAVIAETPAAIAAASSPVSISSSISSDEDNSNNA